MPDISARAPDGPPLPECTAGSCGRRVECVGLTTCNRHVRYELGITFRQLDYWTRQGYLRPVRDREGSGVARKWPATEVAIARLMGRLTRAGLSAAASASAARSGEHRTLLAPGIWIEVTA